MNLIAHYDSPLGGITLGSNGKVLTALQFDNEKYFGEIIGSRSADAPAFYDAECPAFAEVFRWLDTYFSGRNPGFLPPFSLEATPFRREVCEIMLTIPYGQTMTYGQIAGLLAARRGIDRMSAQAVGGAVGHNPISIIIPCHRVVGTGGSLTGYAGGIDKKIQLLELEGADMTGFFVPRRGTAL